MNKPTGWIKTGEVRQPNAAELAAIHQAQHDVNQFQEQLNRMLAILRRNQERNWMADDRDLNEDSDSDSDADNLPDLDDLRRVRREQLLAERRLAEARRNAAHRLQGEIAPKRKRQE